MKVVLKPISNPGIDDIVIEDDLFAVGRREQPFSSMQSGVAARLSRRHARIFREGGTAYVVDLGSTNGTQLEGRRLGTEPAALNDGDVLVFGGELSFRVAIEDDRDDATVVAEPPPVRLVLMPENDALEPLVIESFPFLVSRTDEWVRAHGSQYPEDVKEISRRHAIILMKGNRVYVEDLQSANGTFVGGARLDELAAALNDGDTIAFGTGRFKYRVHLEQLRDDRTVVAVDGARGAKSHATAAVPAMTPDAPSATSAPSAPSERARPAEREPRVERVEKAVHAAPASQEPAASVHDNPRTIYLSSNPKTFLYEVYADQAEEDAPVAEREPAGAAQRRGVGKIAKARAVSRELGDALETGPHTGRRVAIGLTLLLVVGGGLLGLNYWLGADRRQVEQLLDDAAYAESASAANAYLIEHADDQEVRVWGARALVNAVVPEWLGLIERGDFDAAARKVEEAAATHVNLSEGTELLGVLGWATRVEAYVSTRAQDVSMFDSARTVQAIVADWESDSFANRRRIGLISDYVSSFEPTEASLMSTLRNLQNDASVYLDAIDELSASITRELEAGAVAKIESLIREFEMRYPQVRGTAPLRADLQRYETLLALLADRDLLGIADFRGREIFASPVFADHVQGLYAEQLPANDVIDAFAHANEAWRSGDLEGGIVAYQALTDSEWGDVAGAEMQRMRQVMSGYRELQNSREQPDFTRRLLEFRQQLRVGRDDYFLDVLAADLGEREQALLAGLEKSAAVARSEWDAYSSKGGIPSVLRLQNDVTADFREQAQRLGAALTAISEATDGYALVQADTPTDWVSLRTEIINEIERQRRALVELKRVMEPSVVDSKLSLIPRVKETTS